MSRESHATSDKLRWFADARFGMFVHWGPYSVAGRGEWVMNRERIPLEEYCSKYATQWKADEYNPSLWARLAKEAGMKYVVLTARHHDGFCLWDTKTTGWNAAKLGPERDLVSPFVEAMRSEGLRVGLYYSGADWSHPDYPDAYARDWPDGWQDAAARDRFLGFCTEQIEELLTCYGTIDLIWFDGCLPRPFAGERLNQRIYEIQPDILINDRNGAPFDFQVSEKKIQPKEGPWEACFQASESWSYMLGETYPRNPRELLRSMLLCAKDGGNFLLNVGPTPGGAITGQESGALVEIGNWMRIHGDSIYGCSRSPFSWSTQYFLTTKGNRIFIHLLRGIGHELRVVDVANQVMQATWLHDNSQVAFCQKDGVLSLRGLPERLTQPLGMVIVLEVEGEPMPATLYQHPEAAFWL